MYLLKLREIYSWSLISKQNVARLDTDEGSPVSFSKLSH